MRHQPGTAGSECADLARALTSPFELSKRTTTSFSSQCSPRSDCDRQASIRYPERGVSKLEQSDTALTQKGGEATVETSACPNAARAQRRTPGLLPTNPRWSNSSIQQRKYILLESTMSKSEKTLTLPRSLYRLSFVLLPLLALVLSACGTGGNSGSLGY